MKSNTTSKMTNNCIIYCRVSSERQVKEGHGLDSQRQKCISYAAGKNYTVVKTIEDRAISGDDLHRPGLEQVYKFAEEFQGGLILLSYDLNRIARGTMTYLKIVEKLQVLNVKLEYTTMNFDKSPEGQLMENLQAAQSQYFRDKNTQTVVNSMSARVKDGHYPFRAPIGYNNMTTKEKKWVEPDKEKAPIIREALIGYAQNRFTSVADVQRYLNEKFNNPRRSYFLRAKQAQRIINKAEFYAGYITKKQWGINGIKGKHKTIINEKIYYAINEKVSSKEKKAYLSNLEEHFPLRGFIRCSGCGHNLTANFSTSKSKKKYAYYRCNNSECSVSSKNIPKNNIESDFISFLQKYSLKKEIIPITKDIVLELHNKKETLLRTTQEKTIREIKEEEDNKSNQLILLGNKKLEKLHSDIQKNAEKSIFKINLLKNKLNKIKNSRIDFTELFNRVSDILCNLDLEWSKGSLQSKRMIQKLLFPQKISYEKGVGFGTPEISFPFFVLGDHTDQSDTMVELRGIEPLTSTLPA